MSIPNPLRLCLACAALLAVLAPRAANCEPAFGDSTWIAPGWEDAAWYEGASDTGAFGADTPGPRVANPDKDPTGETILRAPFRLVFLPFRLLAGLGQVAVGLIAPSGPWNFEPIVTPDPSIGFGVTRWLDPVGKDRIQLLAIYGIQDRRRARVSYSAGRDTSPRGFDASLAYGFRPNLVFYGVGNESDLGEKAYYLREEGNVVATYRLGRPVRHEVRVTGGLNTISARQGFNGPENAERAEVLFTPAEAPFLERGSAIYSVGAAGDYARLDDVRTPRRGFHVKAAAEQVGSVDESHLDYRHFHVEARAYVPVFSNHQSFAMRALHDWVDPSHDSEAVPYYRLPETDGDLRFKGYRSHRFIDQHLVLGEFEYRWWFSNKLFALLNATAGEVASTASRLRWDDHHESYGLGFRYGYTDRLAARFDAGKGSEGLQLNVTLEDSF